ncbi:MAG: hypothetical protein Q7T33_00955 [Dehalococcoidia bacterium]|nr:hypothetical protein [Dehalococcoidia bacterium]
MTRQPSENGSSIASLLRAVSQWLIGVALAVLLTLFFVATSAVQLSSEGTGQRLLRRSVAVSTQIDAVLPDLQIALRERAREGSGETVRVPDFPVPVDLTRDEALRLEGPALRERILSEASVRLYEDGMSAWSAADPDARQSIETISVPGALKRGLGLITAANHDRMVIAAVVLGVLSAMCAALLAASVRSWGRLVALSAATIVAALPLLAAAVAVRFAFRTAQEEADPFGWGLLELGVEAMWVPIRNYLALTVLGFTLLMLTLLFIWAGSRWPPRSAGARGVDTPAA